MIALSPAMFPILFKSNHRLYYLPQLKHNYKTTHDCEMFQEFKAWKKPQKENEEEKMATRLAKVKVKIGCADDIHISSP